MKIKNSLRFLVPTAAALLSVQFCSLHATVVSFGFSGVISHVNNPSNALPANIKVGIPFSGTLTYDTTALVFGKDIEPKSELGDYYFGAKGGFSVQLTVAGHTFGSTTPSADDSYADIIIHNFSGADDSFTADASAPTLRMDGAPLPGTFDTSGLSLWLSDNSGTAYTNDALPTVPPHLASFSTSHRFELVAYTSQAWTYDLMGNVTNISATSEPALSLRRQGAGTVLAWSVAAGGFTLESSTNLVNGLWQAVQIPVVDTETEHTVTVPTADQKCFYRLKQ